MYFSIAYRNCVFCLSIQPKTNGTRFLSGSYDETIRVWDVREREGQGQLIEAHSDPVTSVDFNEDGTQFVSSSFDGVMRVWDSAYFSLLKEVYAPGAPPMGYAKYTPNGMYILSGTFDSTIRLWKKDETESVFLKEYPSDVSRKDCPYRNSNFCLPVCFSSDNPDKKMIITGNEDPEHSIVCFQVTGKKSTFETLQGHKDTVLALDCAQNSAGKDMLISGGGSRDCCVKIWTQLDD